MPLAARGHCLACRCQVWQLYIEFAVAGRGREGGQKCQMKLHLNPCAIPLEVEDIGNLVGLAQ